MNSFLKAFSVLINHSHADIFSSLPLTIIASGPTDGFCISVGSSDHSWRLARLRDKNIVCQFCSMLVMLRPRFCMLKQFTSASFYHRHFVVIQLWKPKPFIVFIWLWKSELFDVLQQLWNQQLRAVPPT